MNIVIDIRCLINKHRTGVGEYTSELLDALFNIDYADLEDYTELSYYSNQYFLFYNSWKDVSDVIPKWNKKNVHYVVTHFPNKIFNFLVWLKLIKLDRFVGGKWEVGSGKIDYWFSPNIDFINLSKSIKHILTIHDLSYEFFKDCYSWKRRLWHMILRPKKQGERADIILTPSENTARDVVEHFGANQNKVKVLRPGLGSVFNNQQSTINNQIKLKYDLPNKFVLYLGTIEPRKNILGLIEAFKKSSLLVDGCSLVIAGARGWKCNSILKAIDKTPGVKYIGYVDAEDKPALYKMASLFVYPSLYEGFGFPVLEAMACGTPVVTSNRSSLPEVAGGAAYLINPYNVSEIARGMELILCEDGLREILLNNGQLTVGSFDYKQTAKEFLSLI